MDRGGRGSEWRALVSVLGREGQALNQMAAVRDLGALVWSESEIDGVRLTGER